MYQMEVLSPRIQKLIKDIELTGDQVLKDFYQELQTKSTPLVEEIPGDSEHVLLTVVWFADREIKNIYVVGELFGGEIFGQEGVLSNLYQLLETNLWFRTFKVRKDARSVYSFVVDMDEEGDWLTENIYLDQFNPKTFTSPIDEDNPEDQALLFPVNSVLELPEAKNREWVEKRSDISKGKVEKYWFTSQILKGQRRIWIYTPSTELIEPTTECGFAVFTDGWEYVHMVSAPTILDNLIAEKRIPPTYGIFIERTDNRSVELNCNNDYVDFIVKEVLPWFIEDRMISEDPASHVMAGASLGGLFAAYMGYVHPEIFGKVLAHSGAFFRNPPEETEAQNGWIVRKYAEHSKLPIDFYLDLGIFEWWDPATQGVAQMIQMLESKGYNYYYQHFGGGHVYLDWQYTLPDALMFLLGDL